eukprot:TRINITY_DN45273_c0_g1_i1.p1 TRINITY_DN45273_c0_g1~~TRINITY_DN45273_c0_g1_i1.p1  ORF type:complete len:272 (+),score=78.30 TRINITY_DN45273_c0_g1_i1:107-817(+)
MMRRALLSGLGVPGAVGAGFSSNAFALQRRFRSYEAEPTDILTLKKGELILHDGEVGKILSRNTKKTGRGAVQGHGMISMLTGPRRGLPTEIHGMNFKKLPFERMKIMFEEVDEEKDQLVLQYYTSDERELKPTGTMARLSLEAFEDLIMDGEGSIKWLLPDMALTGIVIEEDLIEIKFPPSYLYTVAHVSQVAGRWMALIDENEAQVAIPSPNCKKGDRLMIGLPKGRFLKFNKE